MMKTTFAILAVSLLSALPASAQYCGGKYYTYQPRAIPSPKADYHGVNYPVAATSPKDGVKTYFDVSNESINFAISREKLKTPVLATELSGQGRTTKPVLTQEVISRIEYVEQEEHSVGCSN